jgi:hypothetical protein
LGWGLESSKPIFETYGNPKKVMENVKQISMGRDHSALITSKYIIIIIIIIIIKI